MTAAEAKELMKGSPEYKGLWFKCRMNWFCGIINKKIENDAELGNSLTSITVYSDKTARRYFPLMAKYYEDLDFYVVYSFSDNRFRVIWDLSNFSEYTLHQLKTDSYYDHHIKMEETKNENNCSPKRNRKNSRTTNPGVSKPRTNFNHK